MEPRHEELIAAVPELEDARALASVMRFTGTPSDTQGPALSLICDITAVALVLLALWSLLAQVVTSEVYQTEVTIALVATVVTATALRGWSDQLSARSLIFFLFVNALVSAWSQSDATNGYWFVVLAGVILVLTNGVKWGALLMMMHAVAVLLIAEFALDRDFLRWHYFALMAPLGAATVLAAGLFGTQLERSTRRATQRNAQLKLLLQKKGENLSVEIRQVEEQAEIIERLAAERSLDETNLGGLPEQVAELERRVDEVIQRAQKAYLSPGDKNTVRVADLLTTLSHTVEQLCAPSSVQFLAPTPKINDHRQVGICESSLRSAVALVTRYLLHRFHDLSGLKLELELGSSSAEHEMNLIVAIQCQGPPDVLAEARATFLEESAPHISATDAPDLIKLRRDLIELECTIDWQDHPRDGVEILRLSCKIDPMRFVSESKEFDDLATLVSDKQWLSGKRVLLVDDDAVVRRATKTFLEHNFDAAVHACDSAQQALLDIGRGKFFDLVITDSVMPRVSGSEFIRQLIRRNIKIPIIVVTGTSVSGELTDLYNAGADVVLSKPLTRESLQTALDVVDKLKASQL